MTMVFLHSHGVATARAVRVFKTCGTDAVEVITKNPCRLTRDIRGIGFKIAERLVDLVAGKLPWPDIDVERALPWVEKKSRPVAGAGPGRGGAVGADLEGHRHHGRTGVGKTTLVDAILRTLAAKRVELVLSAPTGRADRRMSKATGQQARTIHRLLEVRPCHRRLQA